MNFTWAVNKNKLCFTEITNDSTSVSQKKTILDRTYWCWIHQGTFFICLCYIRTLVKTFQWCRLRFKSWFRVYASLCNNRSFVGDHLRGLIYRMTLLRSSHVGLPLAAGLNDNKGRLLSFESRVLYVREIMFFESRKIFRIFRSFVWTINWGKTAIGFSNLEWNLGYLRP